MLSGIKSNLPKNSYTLIRACPDGEGDWTYKNEESAKFRKKGKFTTDLVNYYKESIENCDFSPLILVDVGGRISDENREIFKLCTHAVILSSKDEAFSEWEDFCKEMGVKVFLELKSEYNATEDSLN